METNKAMSVTSEGESKHLQIQPVKTSGGHDLSQDLVWQRDPDCSRDQVASTGIQPQMVPVGQPQVIAQNRVPTIQMQPTGTVAYALPAGSQVMPQTSTGYHFQGQIPIIPNKMGDNSSATMIKTFQLPSGAIFTANTGIKASAAGSANYIPVSIPATQPIARDTDGNRIQQNPQLQQNIPIAMPQGPMLVQFNPNFVPNMSSNSQFTTMGPPSTSHQQPTFAYPQMVPYTQYLAVPNQNNAAIGKPPMLNVTVANQTVQKPASLSVSPASLPSPSVVSPGQGVTSPGTESVKSPTYVFMCNKCNYVTPHRSSFKTHYSSHIQYKPFQCDYCDHSTILKQPMQKHIKLKHGIDDAEGFSYETDPKKENIIDFFCNQGRSTMNMEEAKKYLAKYESGQEKLKPGPSKRKLSLDDKDSTSPLKKKKSPGVDTIDESKDQSETNKQEASTGSQTSPRKLTSWKQKVDFRPEGDQSNYGQSKKGETDVKVKLYAGKPVTKFQGFGKRKFTSPTGGNLIKCPFCVFRSISKKGLKKHCFSRHPENRIHCEKCPFTTFFQGDLDFHIKDDQCETETLNVDRNERGKSQEKTGHVGRPRKSLSTSEISKPAPKPLIDPMDNDNIEEDSNDEDLQLDCPHCNFVSHPFALKRHLFFYHKECDWKCKICGFKSDSKKAAVRHSNKEHPNTQPNIVQTFVDISSLLSAEQEASTPPEGEINENGKGVSSSPKLMDNDFIKTNKKRLYLRKKRVSTIEGGEGLLVTKVLGKKGLKRGRKRETKVKDQSSFIVRPKNLKIAKIAFSCVYCTYAAPLRHQLRLHCYEKHTKHPACLMEFSNSLMLEEKEIYSRDLTEETKVEEPDTKGEGHSKETSSGESVSKCEGHLKEKVELYQEKGIKEGSEETETKMDIDKSEVPISQSKDSNGDSKVDSQSKVLKDDSQSKDLKQETVQTDVNKKEETNDQSEVMSCMESILEDITASQETKPKKFSDTLSLISQDQEKTNGYKFSNPFSTLIEQLNSTQLKVKDAFEGSLDEVDIFLERFGVRTLNMDSLTPRQFALFMRKFGNSLQQLTV